MAGNPRRRTCIPSHLLPQTLMPDRHHPIRPPENTRPPSGTFWTGKHCRKRPPAETGTPGKKQIFRETMTTGKNGHTRTDTNDRPLRSNGPGNRMHGTAPFPRTRPPSYPIFRRLFPLFPHSPRPLFSGRFRPAPSSSLFQPGNVPGHWLFRTNPFKILPAGKNT